MVEFKRERNAGVVTGELIIDEGEAVQVSWPEGGATALNINTPIYVGGLDMNDVRYTYMAEKIGPASAASLVGCVDKILYREKKADAWVDYGSPRNMINTQACFENQEDGAFIPTTGGALAVGTYTNRVSYTSLLEHGGYSFFTLYSWEVIKLHLIFRRPD